jgi:glutamyl-tRNA reductase
MALFIYGIHHSRVPVEFRSQVAISPARLSEILLTLKAHANEVVVVSTCNRLEIISETDTPSQVFEAFMDAMGLMPAEWVSMVDHYEQEAAVYHLMAVAAGLDSMVLGEPQILGQLKFAYAQAQEVETTGKFLSRLFQMTFKAAKTIRTDTAIGTQSVSLASAAVKLAKHIFADLSLKAVLLIGTGEMITIAAKHLHAEGVTRMIFANRTLPKAQALAAMYGAQAIALGQLRERLHDVDMVVSATASDVPLVGKGCVERVMKQRRHKPMVMIDLAVPRDIEPEIKHLDDVYLYDIDALKEVVKVGMETRQAAVSEAMAIIENEVSTYTAWYALQPHIANVRAYRQHHEQLRDAALSKALRNVSQGQPVSEVLAQLAHTLTNQLLHLPTMHLLSTIKEKDSA